MLQVQLTPADARARARSQYFTTPAVAQRCLNLLRAARVVPPNARFVEPSAGDGAFSRLLPYAHTLALDMDEALCRAHGHTHVPPPEGYLGVCASALPPPFASAAQNVVLGNPPFSDASGACLGRRRNVALAFVNHSATLADACAFLLGANFLRQRMQHAVTPAYRLVACTDLGICTFRVGSGTRRVRCVFAVWQHRRACGAAAALPLPAPPPPPPLHIAHGVWGGDFAFVRPTCARANILYKRWGRVGTVRTGADVPSAVRRARRVERERRADARYGPQHVTGRTCAADFFIMASPTRVLAVACLHALSRRYLPRDVRAGTSGNNPSVRMADVVHAYLRAKQRAMPEDRAECDSAC